MFSLILLNYTPSHRLSCLLHAFQDSPGMPIAHCGTCPADVRVAEVPLAGKDPVAGGRRLWQQASLD